MKKLIILFLLIGQILHAQDFTKPVRFLDKVNAYKYISVTDSLKAGYLVLPSKNSYPLTARVNTIINYNGSLEYYNGSAWVSLMGYTLPDASTTVKGGVKIGIYVSMTGDSIGIDTTSLKTWLLSQTVGSANKLQGAWDTTTIKQRLHNAATVGFGLNAPSIQYFVVDTFEISTKNYADSIADKVTTKADTSLVNDTAYAIRQTVNTKLSSVSHDATLTGTGTATNVLKVDTTIIATKDFVRDTLNLKQDTLGTLPVNKLIVGNGSNAVKSTGINILQPNHVYFIGGSISSNAIFQAQVGSLLGSNWATDNKGIAGNTTSDVLARFNADILDNADCNVVVILVGINDIAADVPIATIESNIQSMCTSAHNAGITVILCTVTPFKNASTWTSERQVVLDAYNTWILNTCTNVDYKIDTYTALEDPANPDQLLPAYDDGGHIHLSTDGYTYLGTTVYNGATWTLTNNVNSAVTVTMPNKSNIQLNNDTALNSTSINNILLSNSEPATITLNALQSGAYAWSANSYNSTTGLSENDIWKAYMTTASHATGGVRSYINFDVSKDGGAFTNKMYIGTDGLLGVGYLLATASIKSTYASTSYPTATYGIGCTPTPNATASNRQFTYGYTTYAKAWNGSASKSHAYRLTTDVQSGSGTSYSQLNFDYWLASGAVTTFKKFDAAADYNLLGNYQYYLTSLTGGTIPTPATNDKATSATSTGFNWYNYTAGDWARIGYLSNTGRMTLAGGIRLPEDSLIIMGNDTVLTSSGANFIGSLWVQGSPLDTNYIKFRGNFLSTYIGRYNSTSKIQSSLQNTIIGGNSFTYTKGSISATATLGTGIVANATTNYSISASVIIGDMAANNVRRGVSNSILIGRAVLGEKYNAINNILAIDKGADSTSTFIIGDMAADTLRINADTKIGKGNNYVGMAGGNLTVSGTINGSNPILTAIDTLSSASILAGWGKQIIAAPGSGKFINVVSATFIYKYGTTTYSEGAQVYIGYEIGNQYLSSIGNMGTVSSWVTSTNASSYESTPTNKPIYLTVDNPNTTGDGYIKVIVKYTIETY